jgi:hypothetical protein
MSSLLLLLVSIVAASQVSECASDSSQCTPVRFRYTRKDFACAVITTLRYHSTKAQAAKRAWASKCGVVLYISADRDDSLPTTVIAGSEEGRIINKKVFAAFERMWALYGDSGSEVERPRWFIKADDDTFMQLDNLAAPAMCCRGRCCALGLRSFRRASDCRSARTFRLASACVTGSA